LTVYRTIKLEEKLRKAGVNNNNSVCWALPT